MKHILIIAILISTSALAQDLSEDEVIITGHQSQYIAEELDREAGSAEHDDRTRIQLLKVSKLFRVSEDTEDAGLQTGSRNPLKQFLTRMGRGAMRGTTWLSTMVNRPLLNATGYLTGVIEGEKKNAQQVAFYQLFFKHETEFDEALVTARSKEEMAQLMMEVADGIVRRKTMIIIGDYLRQSADQGPLALMQMEPSFVNEHPEYQDLKPLFGELTQSDLEALMQTRDSGQLVSFQSLLKPSRRGYEQFTAMMAPVVGSNVILGIVSISLGQVTSMTLIGAHMASMVSAQACLRDSNQQKIANDPELGVFCNYVIKRAVYDQEKSRNRGYVKGKKARQGINQFFRRNRDQQSPAKVDGEDRRGLDQLNQRPH